MLNILDLGDRTGGMDYSAVAVAILRLVARSKTDRALRKLMAMLGYTKVRK